MALQPVLIPIGRRIAGLAHGLALGGVLYGALAVVFVMGIPFWWWRPEWAQWMTRFISSRAVPLALRLGGIRVEGSGCERARQLMTDGGFILVANHASNLDPLALIKVLGRIDLAFVAKAETLRRPLFGHVVRAMGWFGVERDSLVSLKRFQEQVEARRKTGWVPDLVVFPEGTRSEDGRLQPFRMGPFLLAARTGLPILPVIIRGTHPLHRRNAFAVYPGAVRVDFLSPLRAPARLRGAAELIAAVEDLQRRTEALYRAVPDLNQATGDLPTAAPIAQPSGSGS